MHPVRKKRLITVIFIIIASGVGVSLVLFALNSNLNLFYPPSKLAENEAPIGKTIRAGGCVVPGSITRASDSLQVNFQITDGKATLGVEYEGILPDLFAEGEAAVLTGKLSRPGHFEATEVLAKHDETYMPREVADTMQAGEGKTMGRGDAATCEVIDYDS